MIKDITIGQYFPGKSFIHKLDARTKIILTLLFLVFTFVCKNFWALGLITIVGVVSYLRITNAQASAAYNGYISDSCLVNIGICGEMIVQVH